MNPVFKGNLVTGKIIGTFLVIFLFLFSFLSVCFYWKGYDLLFQISSLFLSPMMFIVFIFIGVILSLSCTQYIINKLYGDQVSLELKEQSLLIQYGKNRKEISFQDFKGVIIIYRNKLLDRITIKTRSGKTYYINVGTILKGVDFTEYASFMKEFSKHLGKKGHLKKTETSDTKSQIIHFTDPSVPQPGKWSSVLKIISSVVLFFGLLIGGIYLVIRLDSDDDPDNQIGHKGQEYGRSYFSSYNNEVYFLRAGDGYFRLNGADAGSFQPFIFENEYGSEMGIDIHSVFSQNQKIEGIDREQAVYLGKNYIRDNRNVFYKTFRIPGADPQTFESLNNPYTNTLIFPYGKDKNRVYYKQFVLPGLNGNFLYIFEKTLEYIKDNKTAYYRNHRLEGVDVSKFTAEKVDYLLSYATDGKKYFVNGIPFPEEVNNRFLGMTKPDLTNLKLLEKKGPGTAQMLFYDPHHIYYFDEQKQEFVMSKFFDKKLQFKLIDKGIFTDGNSVYFTQRYKIRGRRYGNYGDVTEIYKIKDIAIGQFHKIREFKEATLYSDGKNRYVSVKESPEMIVTSSLYLVKNMDFKNGYVGRDNITSVGHTQEIVRIKTRQRTDFEKE